MSEDGSQKSEDRGQRTEVGGQPEVRKQPSKIRFAVTDVNFTG